MRTLTLISAGLGKPPLSEQERLEALDLAPRRSLYERYMNSEMVDETFLERSGSRWRPVTRWLPTYLSQILSAYMLKRRSDAVISWAEHLGLLFAGLLKVTRSSIPHFGIFYWISPRKKARLLSHVHTHFSKIFLMSSYQRDFAIRELKVPPEKVELLRFHVDEKFWRPMPGSCDVVVSSGRERRDYATLVRAIGPLGIPCHIAAKVVPGTRDSWYEELLQVGELPKSVTLGNNETITDVRQWYANSRFVVLPLHQCDAAVGTTVILEAMAMGKAVICSGIVGHRDETLQDGVTGLFVKPEDPDALREAIIYLWERPELARQMGEAGRKRVEEHHTFENWIGTVRQAVEAEIHRRRSAQSHYQFGVLMAPFLGEEWIRAIATLAGTA